MFKWVDFGKYIADKSYPATREYCCSNSEIFSCKNTVSFARTVNHRITLLHGLLALLLVHAG